MSKSGDQESPYQSGNDSNDDNQNRNTPRRKLSLTIPSFAPLNADTQRADDDSGNDEPSGVDFQQPVTSREFDSENGEGDPTIDELWPRPPSAEGKQKENGDSPEHKLG